MRENARVDHLLRATAHAEARHFWFRGLRMFATPLIARAAAGTRTSRILDGGCGTGANIRLLDRFGRAYGIDQSALGLEFAREAGGRRAARASVAAVPFQDATFDLVTSFDVLYALEDADERAAVEEMYRVVRPGGYALINVAAMPMLTGDHSVLSHERRRYTRASLRRLLERGGFTIERLTYTNATLFLPLALLRTVQRRRGLAAEHAATREINIPAAPLNGALTALLTIESWWLRWFDEPFGSSLLCLARKPAGAGAPR
jgi:SAM-dependent methyltransferase